MSSRFIKKSGAAGILLSPLLINLIIKSMFAISHGSATQIIH